MSITLAAAPCGWTSTLTEYSARNASATAMSGHSVRCS